jgi:hypothetical protein
VVAERQSSGWCPWRLRNEGLDSGGAYGKEGVLARMGLQRSHRWDSPPWDGMRRGPPMLVPPRGEARDRVGDGVNVANQYATNWW